MMMMTTPAASTYYSQEQIDKILEETGIEEADLAEYIAWDFLDSGEPLPEDIDELISHINYQQSLIRIGEMTDDETEFGALWAMEHAF